VRARHVVLAGSTGTAEVDAPVAETVLPVSTYVAVTAPLGERLFDAVRYSGAVADNRRAGDYYRIVGDDRLMWGGRISTRSSRPWRLKAALRHDILKVYPQLEGVEIDYAWAGVMAYAVHKMPQIGELAPGYWLAGAFGGHGLNTTAMAGEMIARAILDGDDRWRLFSSYELVWAGGRFGRIAAQTIYWSMQARDALHEKIARYRDRARREAEERQRRYAVERAARKAEEEARRLAEAARLVAEREARRLAAEEAGRAAAERVRLAAAAVEQERREMEQTARLAREAAERERREKEDAARLATRLAAEAAEQEKKERERAARVAAEKANWGAANAASALSRQIEEYKSLTETAAPGPTADGVEVAPDIAEPSASPAPDVPASGGDAQAPRRKSRRRKTKKAEDAVASTVGPAPDSGG
jgi:hypothetical protein